MGPPVWIKKFLEALTTTEKLGICRACCTLNNFRSSSSLTQRVEPADRFTVLVPYASDIIEWELMFNHIEPDLPPDFIFDCHTFEPDLDNVKSLVNWDPRDPLALSHVFTELYSEYRLYQCSLLSKFPRLQAMYNNIIQVIDEKLVEVHVLPYDKKVQHLPTVMFLIKVEGPFEKIPVKRFGGLEGEDLVILKLEFNSPDIASKPVDGVCVSPRLNKAFGNGLQFPALHSMNIPQYITELKDFLDQKIEALDSGLSKRKAYIEAFLAGFSGGVIEADVVEYQTATALINFLDFHFILQVNMPVYFPEKQPKLTFRSVYHTDSSEKPFSKSTRSYPWSPRWLPQEMIERLQSFVAEVVPNFQKISVLEGTGLKYADKSSESLEGYNKL